MSSSSLALLLLLQAVYKPDSQSTDEFVIIIQDESGEFLLSYGSSTRADSPRSRDPSAAKQWLGGDKTIPLVSIVDSFDVFHSGQGMLHVIYSLRVTPADPPRAFLSSGSQGILQRPSKQELETVFGTHNETEIVEQILAKGKFQTGKSIDSLGQSSKNTLVVATRPLGVSEANYPCLTTARASRPRAVPSLEVAKPPSPSRRRPPLASLASRIVPAVTDTYESPRASKRQTEIMKRKCI
jgi:hypothetical protein